MQVATSLIEENILRQVLLKVPEAKPWLACIRFVYTDNKMDVILDSVPENMARKIMRVFSE